MRLVPAGEFTMGSDAEAAFVMCEKIRGGCKLDCLQVKSYPIKFFLILLHGQNEVTNANMPTVLAAGECLPINTIFSHLFRLTITIHGMLNIPLLLFIGLFKAYCEWRCGVCQQKPNGKKRLMVRMDALIQGVKELIVAKEINLYVTGDTTEVGIMKMVSALTEFTIWLVMFRSGSCGLVFRHLLIKSTYRKSARIDCWSHIEYCVWYLDEQ